MNESKCPKCQTECFRDSVDVGVGVIYGPYGCPNCGWSEDSEYDRSNGESIAQKEHPDYYVDQWGGMEKLKRIKENLERFGLNGEEIINEVFKEN